MLAQDSKGPLHSNVRLTLTRLTAGRSVPDLVCAAPAWPHEVNFLVQSCSPTLVRLGLDSYHKWE